MIFQSLISFYERRSQEMPPYGYSVESIGFVINLDQRGRLLGEPEDLRIKRKSNAYVYYESLVPYTNQVNVRANAAAKTPNFMVDKADYIFGMSGKAKKEIHHKSFKNLIAEVCGESTDEGIRAVQYFLDNWNPDDAHKLEAWSEISGNQGKWIAFKLHGDTKLVHERHEVQKLWNNFHNRKVYHSGTSLLDGKNHDIQLQHAQFKFGSGASLVSFNEVAYESYGKKKGENAPISVEAEFKCSTALKHLLSSKNKRIRIGDATTIFWAEHPSPVETFFGLMLDPSSEDDSAIAKVHAFLRDICQGSLPNELKKDKDINFYILGFSVNKARLALRFWYVCSVDQLMSRFRDHFNNLDMERTEKDIPFPGVWHLLKETARETKNISPVLAGSLTRSILTGAYYPQSLYQGVLGRIRADQRVNHLRASTLKAVLMRNHKKEIPMALDTERREIAYLLGRLFAVLEKAQLDALGKINATIKDRFFSAASATPSSVFPRLLRLSQHHIEKAEYGFVSDRRISEIMEHINMFPAHLNLENQGLFAIAYYQQKNALYKKNEKDTEGEKNERDY